MYNFLCSCTDVKRSAITRTAMIWEEMRFGIIQAVAAVINFIVTSSSTLSGYLNLFYTHSTRQIRLCSVAGNKLEVSASHV
jgi:hypothetical protein